ncbi:hypothetical protein APHAL10511_004746 [Amanita phalloides]|nr:hypothetical protein APHAL10511_004746 [Amanita phalloides]
MEGHVNKFGGSPLNRLSWLRSSHTFLNAIITLPTTRWLLFNGGKPLILPVSSQITKEDIGFLTTQDVKPLLGPEPYFGQGKDQGEIVPESAESSGHSPLDAARYHGNPIVFLGVLERGSVSAPLLQDILEDPAVAVAQLGGTPYFAMEVSDLDLSPEELAQFLRNTDMGRQGIDLMWTEPRSLSVSLEMEAAGIFAVSRTMVDWNSKSKYCPACGCRTYSQWGGWKLSCTSLLPWVDNTGRKPCPTAKGLHNVTHPRTDGVVIMVAVDETNDKILLGRGRKFPGRFYSALAGFIEPGETLEDAVKREIWEEAGIIASDVRYHSAQPWPFPANIMFGFYARADSEQPIRTDLDNELVDARWFTREEVLGILRGKSGGLLSQADYKKLTDKHEGRAELAPSNVAKVKDTIKIPPTTAIAGVLIAHWAEGKFSFAKENNSPQRL